MHLKMYNATSYNFDYNYKHKLKLTYNFQGPLQIVTIIATY